MMALSAVWKVHNGQMVEAKDTPREDDKPLDKGQSSEVSLSSLSIVNDVNIHILIILSMLSTYLHILSFEVQHFVSEFAGGIHGTHHHLPLLNDPKMLTHLEIILPKAEARSQGPGGLHLYHSQLSHKCH